ncbi:MAG: hypothetical protein IPN04_11700 [Rhodoferax sp.]|nr:hypothetical protein [Rhodoferax sp.]
MTGTTSATNDSNAANNTAPVTRTIIDAVNDNTTTPFATAATLNVLTNDQATGTTGATRRQRDRDTNSSTDSGLDFQPSHR